MTTVEHNDAARTDAGDYLKMGPDSVPSERFSAQKFYDLERERLWTKTWQPACLLEEIAKVGDYSEYQIVDQSFLIVRVSEEQIKAYYNSCRHRGNELGNGNGSYRSGEIVCSFHGWRWNLNGENTRVFSEQGFTPGCLDRERLKLREVQVGIALGMIWINPDPDAPPLADQIAAPSAYWHEAGIDRMKVRWWRYTVVDANWKLCLEPFMEAYHVAQTHPELAGPAGVDGFEQDKYVYSYDYDGFGNGWGGAPFKSDELTDGGSTGEGSELPPSPVAGMDAADFMVLSNQGLYDGMDAGLHQDWQIAIQNRLYHDEGLRGLEFLGRFYEEMYAEAERRDVFIPSPDVGGGGGYGFLFPNVIVNGAFGNLTIQRWRPLGSDPEKTIFETIALAHPGPDHKAKRPKKIGPLEYEDWGFVLQQDLSNIEKLQRGVKTNGFSEAHYSPRYEGLVLAFHRRIEEFLDRP